jgi:hypothetical protein
MLVGTKVSQIGMTVGCSNIRASPTHTHTHTQAKNVHIVTRITVRHLRSDGIPTTKFIFGTINGPTHLIVDDNFGDTPNTGRIIDKNIKGDPRPWTKDGHDCRKTKESNKKIIVRV